jgi:hypothetical protein
MEQIIIILLSSSFLGSVVSSLIALIITYKLNKHTIYKFGLEKKYELRFFAIKEIMSAIDFINTSLETIEYNIEDKTKLKISIGVIGENYLKTIGQYKRVECFLQKQSIEKVNEFIRAEQKASNDLVKQLYENTHATIDPFQLSIMRNEYIEKIQDELKNQVREYLL